MSQQSIADNLIVLRQQIRQSELNAKRPAGSTSLLAVSKKKSVEDITAAFMAGQKKFGESYLQEALEKKNQLKELPIEWHFIGSIQSNKAKLIAQNFDWVHSVSRLSVGKRLNT